MRPIPKKLLIHTVALYSVTEDRWGKESPGDGQELQHVRLEPSGKVLRNKSSAEIQLDSTLFYDCRNSVPRGLEFSVDDIVVFNNQKFSIQLVEPLYDEKKLHHYELGLIKHA